MKPKSMKKLIPSLIFMTLALGLHAQLGILGSLSNPKANSWESLISQNGGEFLETGINVGINHSIPIPNFGMRLLPELNFANYQVEWDDVTNTQSNPIRLDLTAISFLINTNIYIFNLEGDCDCPTFGKDGGFFEKGFHIEAGPGLSFLTQKGEREEGDAVVDQIEGSNLRLLFNVGLGLDVGISDKFTITPFARFRWNSPQSWEGLTHLVDSTMPEVVDEDSEFVQREFGIKLTYRYKN